MWENKNIKPIIQNIKSINNSDVFDTIVSLKLF